MSEGRDLEKGLRLDRNEKVDNWPKDFIKTVLASKPDGFFSMYPEITPLYTKLANHLRVSEKQLLITSGIDGSIKNLFSVLLEEGDKIGVFSPTYLMYEIYSEIFKIDFFPLTYSTDYKLKQDELDKFLSLNPKILFTNSVRKPSITDMTIIRMATPRAIPIKEKIEITFKNPSFFFGFKYLKAITLSIFEINFNFYCYVIYFLFLLKINFQFFHLSL